MNKEWIFWIVIIAVIAVASLYYRFYNTQSISMSVSMNSSAAAQTIYPYQKVLLPITVQNTGGSAINRLTFVVGQGGNASTSYEITLPAGKSVEIPYNFTPSKPGTYNISVVVDPAKLYNIADRGAIHPSTVVHIATPANAAAYSSLPAMNISEYGGTDLISQNTSQIALIGSTILFTDYGIQSFAPVGQNNSFVYSIVNLTVPYIRNISSSHAYYDNGYYAYAVWVRGYIVPDVFGIAAASRGFQTANYTIGGKRVTFVKFSNYTSGCAWYDGGWTKTVVYHGPSCLGIVNGSIPTLSAPLGSVNETVHGRIAKLLNGSTVGTFSQYSEGNASYAYMTLLSDGEIVSVSVSPFTNNNVCFGVVRSVNGTTFCSSYVPQIISGTLPKISLVKTTSFIGPNNVTVFSLINSSRWVDALDVSAGMIKSLNISGESKSFSLGYGNSCTLNSSISCTLDNFYNSTAFLTLTNNLNKSIGIGALNCFTVPPWTPTRYSNLTILPHASANVTAQCYEQDSPIFGVPVNLHLRVSVNYTESGREFLVSGNATANIFS